MTKPLHDYTEAEWAAVCPVEPRTLGQPRAGYFRVRGKSKAPWLPARIKAYRPRVAGTDHFDAHIGGVRCSAEEVWHSGREITRELYDQLMANPPSQPFAPVSHRRNKDIAA